MTKGWSNFKYIRVFILLFMLFIVAGDAWLDRIRSTEWDATLNVVVVPINPENSDVVNNYIATLDVKQFKPIENFFNREADKFLSLPDSAFDFFLGEKLNQAPPLMNPNGQLFETIVWSLKSRYWAYQAQKKYAGFYPDIMLFVNYYDPKKHHRLQHSVGLEKGLFAIIYGFGSKAYKKQNHVVIAHELLHTLGASDKYDLSNNQPLFPIGYADTKKRPLYPQSKAELMAGRVPVSENKSVIPKSLNHVIIGPETALEINWLKNL